MSALTEKGTDISEETQKSNKNRICLILCRAQRIIRRTQTQKRYAVENNGRGGDSGINGLIIVNSNKIEFKVRIQAYDYVSIHRYLLFSEEN